MGMSPTAALFWGLLRDGILVIPGILMTIALVVGRLVPPFEREFFTNDETISHKMARPETISSTWLFVIATAIPSALVILWSLRCRFSFKEILYSVNALLLAITWAMLVTDVVKVVVGRLRPDFLDRCKPFIQTNGSIICTGDPHEIRGGRVSFPSGHSSLTFAGWTFLAIFVRGTVSSSVRRSPWVSSFLIGLLFVPLMVAISRTVDYRHHWQDVTAGGLLGIAFAVFWYRQVFLMPLASPASVLGSGDSQAPFTPAHEATTGSPWQATHAQAQDPRDRDLEAATSHRR